MSTISTHILDTSLGRPAAGVLVTLERIETTSSTPMVIMMTEGVGTAVTDANGRIATFAGSAKLEAGTYRLRFDTAEYFTRTERAVFYPDVVVTFRVEAADEHFHIPLLLSPFGYSTYRGS